MFSGPQLPEGPVVPPPAAPLVGPEPALAPVVPAVAVAIVPAVDAELPATLWLGAAEPPVLEGFVGVVLFEAVEGFAPDPPLLVVGAVAAAPPDPALAVPAVDPALLAEVAPDVGAPVAGFDVVLSPPQPKIPAPATMIVDAQSRCEFVMFVLRAPVAWRSGCEACCTHLPTFIGDDTHLACAILTRA